MRVAIGVVSLVVTLVPVFGSGVSRRRSSYASVTLVSTEQATVGAAGGGAGASSSSSPPPPPHDARNTAAASTLRWAILASLALDMSLPFCEGPLDRTSRER